MSRDSWQLKFLSPGPEEATLIEARLVQLCVMGRYFLQSAAGHPQTGESLSADTADAAESQMT